MKPLRTLAWCLAAAGALSLTVAGCAKNKDQAATAELIPADTGVTERHDKAEVTLDVSPGGRVKAFVKNNDGQLIKKGVTGSVTVKPLGPDATPATIPVSFHPDSGLLLAQGPKLKHDLTEVTYDLQVDGARVQGTVHVPRGGTRELVEGAEEAAKARSIAPDTKGPNGGIVQIVGDDIVEIVADKDSGATRMYFLDDDLKVVPVGKKKGKLAFVGGSAQYVDLDPDPSGLYLVGKVVVKVQPIKITVVVIDGDEVDVVLCNHKPGAVIIVGALAPVFPVFIVTGWPVVVVPAAVVVQPGVVVVHPGKGKKGKGKFKVKVW